MSSASRKRKAMLRRQRAAFKAVEGLTLFNGVNGPPWTQETADEVIARMRKLLGHSPMADFAAGYELRARFVWPQRPMVHFLA